MVKRALDEFSLWQNGITFNRNVMGPKELGETLGEQVEILARRLLDFHRFAPQKEAQALRASKDRSLLRRFNSENDDPVLQSKIDRETKKLKTKAVQSHKEAMKIVAAVEDRWMDWVKTNLFSEMVERARAIEGARTVTDRELAKAVRVDGNADWTAAHQALSWTTPSAAPTLKRARPDLFISLPAIEEERVPRGFARQPWLRNFCVDTLELLEDEGVMSNPLRMFSGNKLKEKHRVCFPCVILEAKHHEVRNNAIEKCYSQAANGTASALALLDTLTQDDSRPVVALTLVGHKTRLWIAAVKSRRWVSEIKHTPTGSQTRWYMKLKYHMQCVWKGDLNYEEPTTELTCIVQSLEKWVIEDFRPWVSDCIDTYFEIADSESEEGEGHRVGDGSATNSAYDTEEDDSESDEGSDEESGDETDEEERNWDEDWYPAEGEEGSDSESDSDPDDEDQEEYERDKGRIDSLMEDLSLTNSPKATTRVTHRFIKVRKERGV
ncbi:hypothetical protein BDV12DRAFT_177820 [Aspergillus spectabilis]